MIGEDEELEKSKSRKTNESSLAAAAAKKPHRRTSILGQHRKPHVYTDDDEDEYEDEGEESEARRPGRGGRY